MNSIWGPNANDPLGLRRETMGAKIVDTVVDELELSDCLLLAMNRAEKLAEHNPCLATEQITLKIQEALLWSRMAAQTLPKGTPV